MNKLEKKRRKKELNEELLKGKHITEDLLMKMKKMMKKS